MYSVGTAAYNITTPLPSALAPQFATERLVAGPYLGLNWIRNGVVGVAFIKQRKW